MSHLFQAILLFGWAITLTQTFISSISGDIFILKQVRKTKSKKKRDHLPMMSVIIPAYNEELTIARTLESVRASNYPAAKFEVIVVNDGSADRTKETVQTFKRENKEGCKIRLINRPNKGKARSLNHALRRCAKGRLVMCLDADSSLDRNALRNAAQYFRDRNTIALCGHVDVMEDGTILALAQRLEYIAAFRLKGGQTQLGVNYIIPGTGSVFRKNLFERVSYYEANTLAEDFDLTIKIIDRKKRKERIAYGPDVVTYTEAVHSVKALMKQRFRWNFGIAQVFFKRSSLFFSNNSEHMKRLTWGMLPFSILQDLAFLFNPLLIAGLAFYALRLNDLETVGMSVIGFSLLLSISIWSTAHLKSKDKLRLTYYVPPAYILIYLVIFANYAALLKTVFLAPGLKASITKRHFSWQSPERKRASAAA